MCSIVDWRFAALYLLAFATVEASVEFTRDVKPILAEACYQCHGPDPESRKADLRLDTEKGFFNEESPTVVKGDASQSPLYQRLISTVPDERMPPPESHKDLKPEEIALIKQWIDDGATWEGHWSFEKPVRAPLPEVTDREWVRNGIDHFVLAKLESLGLTPAAEADPRTLVRRLALDLTGLPPAPGIVEAYAANPTEEAWNDLVEQLFESPHYGEHRARYWLDAARYADTHGLHFDNYREMWPYRDWVIASFNRNQPYNEFTVEQLAGDLLPDPTQDQLIATGLQRCNITTNEGGTIAEENLANYAADRVQTFGWIYMGLTTNCAQCHDHKFDPFTQKDYYSLAAFFRNTTQGAMDGNTKDGRGPAMTVPLPEDAPRWQALEALIPEAQTARDKRRDSAKPDYEAWLGSVTADQLTEDLPNDLPMEGLVAHRSEANPKGLDSVGDFESDQAFSVSARIRPDQVSQNVGILARMDVANGFRGWDLYQQGRQLSAHLVNAWPDAALKVTTRRAVLKPKEWHDVTLTYDGSGKARGLKLYINGKSERLDVNTKTLKPGQTIRTTTPFKVGQRSAGDRFSGVVQDFWMHSRNLTEVDVQRLVTHVAMVDILGKPADQRSAEDGKQLFENYLQSWDEPYQKLNDALLALEKERDEIQGRSPITHVQREKVDSPAMANILMRGQYDRVGEQVGADTPSAFLPLPKDAPKNRLGLAEWTVHPDNPLTARVTVNRFWQELFGKGLVYTAEDFGIMGTPPTHPELLDWLAVTFVEQGWDVKGFFKMLANSATYRQAARVSSEKREKDPDNAFFSRGPRFRMDAEMLRDYALTTSGLMSTAMGGPSTRPYQPEGIWDVVGLPGGDTRNYTQDKGEGLYRRTLYNFWKRMAPPPNLEVFNAPSREACTVRRERTNTPLQALTTMNDPQYVEAARCLAQNALAASKGDSEALDHMAQRVLCRPLRSKEREILDASLAGLESFYNGHEAETKALLAVGEAPVDDQLKPSKLAAWTMLANQLLNLDEALTK